jgi:TolB-like protein/Flp pilus assembly protein TadD
MAGRIASELLSRRIPQVAGIYLAAGWGLLEFTQWAVGQFQMRESLVLWVAGLLATLFIPTLAVAWRLGGRLESGAPGEALPSPSGSPPPRSIAVLPFTEIPSGGDESYLSWGLAEEILHTLASVPGLKVASRTSSFAFHERGIGIREIGRQLHVGTILEGSVRRTGEEIVVSTQLINVADGYQIWSRRFDRKMEDVFRIQREIARDVAEQMELILGGEAGRPLTSDVRAYEFYLRGRHHFRKSRKRHLLAARDLFGKAVELDPGFALAWAGIAESICLLSMYYPSARIGLDDARAAGDRAVALAPLRAEGHTALGVSRFLQGDQEGAAASFARALELDPAHFDAHYFLGRVLFQAGDFERAAESFGTAASVREDDYQAAFFHAQATEAQGRHGEAMEGYQRALEAAERYMELHSEDPRAATMRAVSLCRVGRTDEGLSWGRRALELDPEDAGVRYNVACLYAVQGEVDRALECLEEALRVGFGNREWLKRDPDLDSLREDPRFEALIERRVPEDA